MVTYLWLYLTTLDINVLQDGDKQHHIVLTNIKGILKTCLNKFSLVFIPHYFFCFVLFLLHHILTLIASI